jgi:phage-related protein
MREADGQGQRRRWRDYQTAAGNRPVKKFLDELSDYDAAAVVAAMKEVRLKGLEAARHLEGDIWEVRAEGDRVTYRVLFAPEGANEQVLLALHGFKKKTQKTPPDTIRLAKRRLKDWRERGAKKRAAPRDKRPKAR